MECTRCCKIMDKEKFSFKNNKHKIYYMYCDNCREKVQNMTNKRDNEKRQYEFVKKTNTIVCQCGKQFVSFRDYHVLRHNSTKSHLNFLQRSKKHV